MAVFVSRVVLAWIFIFMLSGDDLSAYIPVDSNSLSSHWNILQMERNFYNDHSIHKNPLRQNVFAQQDSNVTLIGRWGYGPGNTVFVQWDYAYLGSGRAVQILDISNPSSPRKLGVYVIPSNNVTPDSRVRAIYVSGKYAYVASGDLGLWVINVSDPSTPHEVAHYHSGGVANSVCISGKYAYITNCYSYMPSLHEGLQIIDISDASNPRKVGYFDTGDWTSDVYVSDEYAYVTDAYNGLRIVDISNPTNPNGMGHYLTPSWAYAVYVSGSYAYVADFHFGLRIIDVSDPQNPFEVGYFDTYGTACDVHVSGNYAYVAEGYEAPPPAPPPLPGLRIIDVSDPQNPFQVGYFNTGRAGWTTGVYVQGNYAFITVSGGCLTGLRIIDISDPQNPYVIGYFNTAHGLYSLWFRDQYVYANGTADLVVIDASDPTHPYEIGSFCESGGGWRGGVYVDGSYAYVGLYQSLLIIDISDPANPDLVAQVHMVSVNDVYVSGDFAYVTQSHLNRPFGSLDIVDVSDLTHPYLVGHLDIQDDASGVWVSGHYAYVAAYGEGLLIINVSDPAKPYEVGRCGTNARNVHVSEGYAYVAAGDALRIVDVSKPSNPYQIGYSNIEGYYCNHVFVSGDYAYASELYNGLYIINISNPSTPMLAGYFKSQHSAWESYVSGNYVYLGGEGGLYILEFIPTEVSDDVVSAIPEEFNLLRSDPNPFNDETSIQYLLPQTSNVLLELYNCQGQVVRTLVNGSQVAGQYIVRWDGLSDSGQEVASGVYFCRLSVTANQSIRWNQSRKLVLLR